MAYPTPLYAVTRQVSKNKVYTISTPFMRSGVMSIGARSTFLRIGSNNDDVAVVAPIPFGDECQRLLVELGVGARGPRYLIAPDAEHHIGLKSWKERYPECVIIGVEGLGKIEAKRNVKVDIQVTQAQANRFLSASDIGLGRELDKDLGFVYMPSHPNKELMVYHGPSKCLIEADAVFNLPPNEQYSAQGAETLKHKGLLTSLANRYLNTTSVWQKRIAYYILFRKDRRGVVHGLEEIKKLDIEYVIPCHGDVFDKPQFLSVFSYFGV